jgi:hypothetical protein
VPDVRPGQPGRVQVALERVAVGVAGRPAGDGPFPAAQLLLERRVGGRVGEAEEVPELAPQVPAVGRDEDRATGRRPDLAACRPDRVIVDAVVGVVVGASIASSMLRSMC